MVLVIGYVILSLAIIIINIFLAALSFNKKSKKGKYLGLSCISSSLIGITYLLSVLFKNYLFSSMMSSLYFIFVDVTLIFLLHFVGIFCKNWSKETNIKITSVVLGYFAVDLVVFLINPFYEIAISYVERNTIIAYYSYVKGVLYWLHLAYCYVMVAIIFYNLIHKAIHVPKEYKNQYVLSALFLFIIILINCVFLYVPGNGNWKLLDYSILGYSICGLAMYYCCFYYSKTGMLNVLKISVFENIDQGIVLFDYYDHLILTNSRANQFFKAFNIDDDISLNDFVKKCRINIPIDNTTKDFSIQCYFDNAPTTTSLRCDFRNLFNSKRVSLGKLFVFADVALETDLCTGFQKLESFKKHALENKSVYSNNVSVVICDINKLSLINSTQGYEAGSILIKELSSKMKKCFPNETYFVRGDDANLIAISFNRTENYLQDCIEHLVQSTNINFQYSICVSNITQTGILSIIDKAKKGLKSKKLLDKESLHSSMITSLIKALQECDSDTEAHVKRTQDLGYKLGKRIGLSDVEQSDLALLCILHDIGKIGVPLELLNKPSKLTDEEMDIVKSHVEKGYQIAMSTPDLMGIADMIKAHHERWDGKGYPYGLSRESTPILSRVISVVDSFDAMTHDRVYKKAKPIPVALNEIKQLAGSQFDPYIASEFLQMYAEDIQVNTNTTNEYFDPAFFEKVKDEVKASKNSLNIHNVKYSRYILDEDNFIIEVDENFYGLTGYRKNEITKLHLSQNDLIPQEDRYSYFIEVTNQINLHHFAYIEHRLLKKDGSIKYVLCYGRRYYDSASRKGKNEIIVLDTGNTYANKLLVNKESDKAEIRLKQWENTYRRDSLTNLLTHDAFKNDLECILLQNNKKIAFIMTDLNKFKEYNDTYGHHAGDEYLILTAQALQNSVRREDLVCRMGGDEFALALLFDLDTPEKFIKERIAKLYDKVNMTLQSINNSKGLSMGVAISDEETNTFNKLYVKADKKMYASKKDGTNDLDM